MNSQATKFEIKALFFNTKVHFISNVSIMVVNNPSTAMQNIVMLFVYCLFDFILTISFGFIYVFYCWEA